MGIKSLQQATKENNQAIVNASFHVTQWNVSPFGTGLSRLKNQQCVFGGDVLRSVSFIMPPYWYHLSVIVFNIMFYLINAQVHPCRRWMSDNPINLVTGIFRDKVIYQENFMAPGRQSFKNTFSVQHNCVWGRLSDAAGQVSLETRVGQNKMGRWLHQLVSSYED